MLGGGLGRIERGGVQSYIICLNTNGSSAPIGQSPIMLMTIGL